MDNLEEILLSDDIKDVRLGIELAHNTLTSSQLHKLRVKLLDSHCWSLSADAERTFNTKIYYRSGMVREYLIYL